MYLRFSYWRCPDPTAIVPTSTSGGLSTLGTVATFHTTNFIVSTNSNGAFTTLSTMTNDYTTTLPMGSMPSVGGGGATNTDTLKGGAAAHGLLAGILSGGAVLSIVFLVVGLLIWRRRRMMNRDPEDEQHLFRPNCKSQFINLSFFKECLTRCISPSDCNFDNTKTIHNGRSMAYYE